MQPHARPLPWPSEGTLVSDDPSARNTPMLSATLESLTLGCPTTQVYADAELAIEHADILIAEDADARG